MINIQFRKLHHLARTPSRANDTDAGSDLFAIEDKVIAPLHRQLIRTGISISMPESVYGRIAPRSGLAFKHGIDVLAGVIDPGYTGEIGVVLFNTDADREYQISSGDRIAQIIFEPFHKPLFIEVEELHNSDRGQGGFGSTGN